MKFRAVAIPNPMDSWFFIKTLEPDITKMWNGRLRMVFFTNYLGARLYVIKNNKNGRGGMNMNHRRIARRNVNIRSLIYHFPIFYDAWVPG
jgi:hypothetical protein